MRAELKQEVDVNYEWFISQLPELLSAHRDEYALLKARTIVGFFGGPGDAYRADLARFDDKVFSVQQVTDEIEELGAMAYILF